MTPNNEEILYLHNICNIGIQILNSIGLNRLHVKSTLVLGVGLVFYKLDMLFIVHNNFPFQLIDK